MDPDTNSTNLIPPETSGDCETSKTGETVSANEQNLFHEAMADSWDFEENDLVMVVWDSPETFKYAPWLPLRRKLEKEPTVGCSVGFAQDLYDYGVEVIALFPHEISGSSGSGVVFVPYGAIRAILPLEVRLPRNAYPAALARFAETSRPVGRNELGG
jgi:hypothetical protein